MHLLVQAIRERGVGSMDRFASDEQVTQLRACADLREIRGEFSAASIGTGPARRQRADIRGDRTCWLAEPLFPSEHEILRSLERLRLTLNQELFLGLFDCEIHYACYPPGSFYARHLDQPANGGNRILSFVLYLNLDWSLQAGGELRIYEGDVVARSIDPIGGRLVCFLTEGREHEVAVATRTRLALSGWFRARH